MFIEKHICAVYNMFLYNEVIFLGIYNRKLKLTADYAAMNGRMRTSAMFSLLQDAAFEDITARGAGADYTEPRGLMWMVVHMRAEIIRLPEYLDDISLVTWPGEGKHSLYIRYYEILDASGAAAVRASGTWVLADAVKRCLVQQELGITGVVTGRETEAPVRLRMPEVGSRAAMTARYSQADINGHTNNARYLDMAEDLMPIDYLMSHSLNYAAADYLSEVLPGQEFVVRYGQVGGDWWFQGEGDKPCFRVKLSYI
jgi:medium-chain acyl-[acyl-carrier-protein] hydrolase